MLHLAWQTEGSLALKPLVWVGRYRDHDGDTYRAVYCVRPAGVVYALHAFQKKSRKGTATGRRDMELVKRRLEWAEQIHARTSARRGGERDEET